MRLTSLLAVITLAPAPAVRAQSAPVPVADTAARKWADEIAEFRAADRLHPPRPGGVVFVGSSSIRLWPDLAAAFPGVNVIQRGFGGSVLPDVVYRIPEIVTPYRPRLIVLYAGDNDLAEGATPQRIFNDYRNFVQLVRKSLPRARIAFVSIKPSIARATMIRSADTANRLIRNYASGHPRLLYIDVFTPMLNAAGQPRPELFAEDGLHLNARGYALWQEILAPIVRQYADHPSSERPHATR